MLKTKSPLNSKELGKMAEEKRRGIEDRAKYKLNAP